VDDEEPRRERVQGQMRLLLYTFSCHSHKRDNHIDIPTLGALGLRNIDPSDSSAILSSINSSILSGFRGNACKVHSISRRRVWHVLSNQCCVAVQPCQVFAAITHRKSRLVWGSWIFAFWSYMQRVFQPSLATAYLPRRPMDDPPNGRLWYKCGTNRSLFTGLLATNVMGRIS
jgi:hypothetical protein